MKVLCLGAEPTLIEKIQMAVRFRWPESTFLIAADPGEGLELLASEPFDLAFYCPQPPNPAITAVCEQIREFCDIPLIVVADMDGDGLMDEVRALDAGADDYVQPGAGLIDLASRVVALMRRIWRTNSTGGESLVSGSLLINVGADEVYVSGQRVTLTATEYNLLLLLVKHRGTVVQHLFLEQSLWGDHADRSGLLKKYVRRLRQKLGDATDQDEDWIRNVYGVGYQFVGPGYHDEEQSVTA